jgi:hypothetical protein
MANRSLRLLSIAVLAGLFAVASPVGRASACSCAMMGPAERLANADAAFIGIVAGLQEPDAAAQPELSLDPVRYTFAVEEPLRGAIATRALVTSSRDNGANCGVNFAVAQRWQVYAYADETGWLTTNGCSGNELLAEGVPIPASAGAPAGGPPAQLLLALGAVGVVGGISVWAFARRGRSTSA